MNRSKRLILNELLKFSSCVLDAWETAQGLEEFLEDEELWFPQILIWLIQLIHWELSLLRRCPQNHQVVAYRNLDELNQKFYSVTFACGKDVLDSPPEIHITYRCQLGAEARKVYWSLERDLIAEVQAGEITAANALVKLLRLQQITGGCIRIDEGHEIQIDSAKMNLLRDVLEAGCDHADGGREDREPHQALEHAELVARGEDLKPKGRLAACCLRAP